MDALGGTALLHRYRAMIRRPIVEPAPREPGRARKAREHAAAAMQPASNGYIVPPVPAGLSATRKWLRRQHDAYSRRQLTGPELNECRYTMRGHGRPYAVLTTTRSANHRECLFATSRCVLGRWSIEPLEKGLLIG